MSVVYGLWLGEGLRPAPLYEAPKPLRGRRAPKDRIGAQIFPQNALTRLNTNLPNYPRGYECVNRLHCHDLRHCVRLVAKHEIEMDRRQGACDGGSGKDVFDPKPPGLIRVSHVLSADPSCG